MALKKKRVAVASKQLVFGIDDKWPAVIVEWYDAMSEWGDFKLDSIESSLPLRRSIGFLVEMNEKEIRIVGTDDRKNSMGTHAGDMLRVPTGMISTVIPLTEESCRSRNRSKKVPARKRSRRVLRK